MGYQYEQPSFCVPGTVSFTKTIDRDTINSALIENALTGKLEENYFARYDEVGLKTCSTWSGLMKNVIRAFALALLIALAGLAVRWIDTGFKQNGK